jgi:hypothetical protein
MQAASVHNAISGSLTWLSVCLVAGFVAVARLGDFGSIAHLLMGLGVGLAGAVSHALLSSSGAFRRCGVVRRALINWLSGYLVFAAVALLLLAPKANADHPQFWIEIFRFFVLYTGAPMLVLSFVVAWTTRQRA